MAWRGRKDVHSGTLCRDTPRGRSGVGAEFRRGESLPIAKTAKPKRPASTVTAQPMQPTDSQGGWREPDAVGDLLRGLFGNLSAPAARFQARSCAIRLCPHRSFSTRLFPRVTPFVSLLRPRMDDKGARWSFGRVSHTAKEDIWRYLPPPHRCVPEPCCGFLWVGPQDLFSSFA
jgi:hypothetical protein